MISHKQFLDQLPAHLRVKVADELYGRIRPDGKKRTCCGQKEAAIRVIHDVFDEEMKRRLRDIMELALVARLPFLHFEARSIFKEVPELKKARVWYTACPAERPMPLAEILPIDPNNPPPPSKVVELATGGVDGDPASPA